jgi:hypothetical protein
MRQHRLLHHMRKSDWNSLFYDCASLKALLERNIDAWNERLLLPVSWWCC